MPEANHTCIICGSRYYCCESRERLRTGSWAATCCSAECWNKYCDIMQERMKELENCSEDPNPKRARRTKTTTK